MDCIGALLLWAFSTKWKMPKGAANRLGFMAIVLACYTLYICICGGDIFPAFRLMITAIVILAFILIEIANL
ncbi:MAG: hypothetical protein EBX53_09365, partial [Betaproteobacteria bacterium]|nr:hypothetical protein [Betaproteobacteria bacterium]